MSSTDRAFAGSIPAIYDRYLGPLIFHAYAEDMTKRVARLAPKRLLETAAGTGIVTRALAARLPQSTEIVATDLNQAMIDFAMPQIKAANVSWKQADATKLPFGDAEFDAVTAQFGVMFFPDKMAGYREARRVLKPGGSFVFNVWDRLENNLMAKIIHDSVAKAFPKDPPGFLGRTPFGYYDTDAIRKSLSEAGFKRIEVDTVRFDSRAPSQRDPAIGYCQGSPLRAEIEAKHPGMVEKATEIAADALAAQLGKGAIEAPIQAHVFTAEK
jgi:ubiquinone/menaquinone biosynthesis C-methylase UbiE